MTTFWIILGTCVSLLALSVIILASFYGYKLRKEQNVRLFLTLKVLSKTSQRLRNDDILREAGPNLPDHMRWDMLGWDLQSWEKRGLVDRVMSQGCYDATGRYTSFEIFNEITKKGLKKLAKLERKRGKKLVNAAT